MQYFAECFDIWRPSFLTSKFKGISIIGSNRSGIFLHLMPIFSTILAMIIFKEKFMTYHIIGAMLIITGIILSSKKKYE